MFQELDLQNQVRKMNLLEKDELESLGQTVDSEGNAGLKLSIFQRIKNQVASIFFTNKKDTSAKHQTTTLTRDKGVSRRDFIKYAGTGAVALTVPLIPKAQEQEPSSEWETAFQEEIDRLLSGKNASFFLELIDENGESISRVSHNEEVNFSVASAFKSVVLLWYLISTPQRKWQLDRGSDAFNMIVYSHNRATGNLMRRAALAAENPIVAFNSFLESFGLEGMIGAWDFDSDTSGFQDTSMFRNIRVDEANFRVSNTSTAKNLADFYKVANQILSSPELEHVSEAFYTLLQAKDLRFLSPFEEALLRDGFQGKDGYLSPNTFGEIGAARVDAGLIPLADGKSISMSLMTFDEGETLATEIAALARRHLSELPEQFEVSSVSQSETLHEHFPYFFTGDSEIDIPGEIEFDGDQIDYLSNIAQEVNGMPLGAIISVNCFDGTVSFFEIDGDKNVTKSLQFVSLVGERLPFDSDSPATGDSSDFDSRVGIYNHSRQNGIARQHTMTPPLIGLVQGSHQSTSFGGLSTNTPVPFLAMKLVCEGSDGRKSISGLNSEFTVHTIPELDRSDPGYAHYETRTEMLSTANSVLSDVGSLPFGFDSYWSHGCVNVLPDHFRAVRQKVRENVFAGKSVLCVFSNKGERDLSKLLFSEGFESRNHALYGESFYETTGRYFQSY